MADRIQTNGMWTKIPDQLADDLNMGLITFEEYGLLIYMLQRADKKTGILVSNSGSLASQVHKDRAWIHNRLTALRKKERIIKPQAKQNQTSAKPQLNQRRGSRNPYPVGFSDHLPMNGKTSGKPELNQSQTSGKPLYQTSENGEDGGRSQSEQGVDDVGTDVAFERDLDLDREGEKNKPEPLLPSAGDSEKPEADQFISLLMLRFKLPSLPAYGMVNNMIHKYTLEACVAAMESSKPTSKTWQGILAYISKVAAGISAQSRGITGEKLDKLEKEYQELYCEVTEYREYFDANEKDFPADKRKESAKWLDRNENKLAMARHTIEQNGGSLEVRR